MASNRRNPRRHSSIRRTKKHMVKMLKGLYPHLSKAQEKRERAEISRIIRAGGAKSYGGRLNPPRVKGRKVKGGRAVTVRNFTGTVVKKRDGTVQIVGRGRR